MRNSLEGKWMNACKRKAVTLRDFFTPTAAVGTAILTLSGTLLLSAFPAYANDCQSSPDDGARTCFYSDKRKKLELRDAKGDHNSVYVVYSVNGNDPRKLANDSGFNTSVSIVLSEPSPGSISYQTCTEYDIGGDSCSNWLGDRF